MTVTPGTDPRPLDCGNCHGCCHQLVVIMPEDGGNWKLDASLPMPALARRDDGSCVYLDPLVGCMVYDRRPVMCREFHCGDWFNKIPQGTKRAIRIEGSRADKDMLASGERHSR